MDRNKRSFIKCGLKLGAAAFVGASLAAAPGAEAKVEGNEIVLGAAVSLTGQYSTNGMHTRNGYDLAVKYINQRGGLNIKGKDYRLKIIYYDDESTPARAGQLAERLIVQDGVKFMLGPYSSGLTKAMAPVTERYKIPMIEANGASRSLFTKGYKYLFAILTSADQYLASSIDLLVSVAKLQGKSAGSLKVAMAFENDPFSQDVRLGVLERIEKHGMKVVIDDRLPRLLDDMSATLTKVKAVKPDLLLVSGHAKGAATAVRQIEQFRVNVPMLAMTHCDSAAIEQKFPKGAEFTLCARQWQKELTYRDDDKLFGGGEDFVRAFRSEYGYEPPYQAAESAAAVQVWAYAFRRSQSFDTERLRSTLARTKIQTFYGNINFDDTGRNHAKPMVMSQIIEGRYRVVSPQKWATTEVIYPRPKL